MDGEREGGRDIYIYICWLTPQMSTTARAEANQSQKTSSTALRLISRELAGWDVKQLGLELAPLRGCQHWRKLLSSLYQKAGLFS